jgi:hypothetical protein
MRMARAISGLGRLPSSNHGRVSTQRNKSVGNRAENAACGGLIGIKIGNGANTIRAVSLVGLWLLWSLQQSANGGEQ